MFSYSNCFSTTMKQQNVELFKVLLFVSILFLLLVFLFWYRGELSYLNPSLKKMKESRDKRPQCNITTANVCVEHKDMKKIKDSEIKRFRCNNSTINDSVQHRTIKKICTGPGTLWTNVMDFDKCEVKSCILERNLSKSKECEAILLESNNLGRPTLPRLKEQIWVLVSHESPFTFLGAARNKIWRRAFNWIFSYQKNSDIFFPWGKIVAKEKRTEKNYDTIFDMKNGTAVWLASNCRTQSKREKYVDIMRKIIDIDIYGKCGNFKCKNIVRKNDPNDVCRDQKSKQYKFYLSFENALCPDYITEKIFLFYQYDRPIIPVVRGISNAKEFLPKNTYVDASEFDNATQLAHYLKELGNDRKKYITMLEEKDKFTVETLENVFQKAMCSLCKKLHRSTFDEECVDTVNWHSQRFSTCREPVDLL